MDLTEDKIMHGFGCRTKFHGWIKFLTPTLLVAHYDVQRYVCWMNSDPNHREINHHGYEIDDIFAFLLALTN